MIILTGKKNFYLLVVCGLLNVLLAQQVLAQTTGSPTPPDELRYKGSETTNDNVSPSADTNTNIITDPDTNQNNNNNNNPLVRPNDFDRDDDDDNQQQQQQQQQQHQQMRPPFLPFNIILPFEGTNRETGPSPFGGPNSLFGGLFGGRLFDHLDRRAQEMEREFSNLERQAGEGQDVSYFQRNGEAYVRTCTTRKIKPGEQISANQQLRQLNGRAQRSR